MKTADTLDQLVKTSRNTRLNPLKRKGAFSKEINAQITSLTFQIKDNLTFDYCTQLECKEGELEELNKLIDDFIKTGSAQFNSHFIQLLCWNIFKIKPIIKKNDGKKVKLSFFEYQPDIFDFNPITKRFFQLLLQYDDCKEKISDALMMVYLNNYQYASEYFCELLKQYLKTIKFPQNLNLFFDVTKAGSYRIWRIYNKSFFHRVELFQVRSAFFNTKYFQDAWYFWMKTRADVINEFILEDLSCNFFTICSDAEKLLILSRVIIKNNNIGKNIESLYYDQLEDLFPIDPFIPENWIFNCNAREMKQLVTASNIFQSALTKNPELMFCVNNSDEIKVFRY